MIVMTSTPAKLASREMTAPPSSTPDPDVDLAAFLNSFAAPVAAGAPSDETLLKLWRAGQALGLEAEPILTTEARAQEVLALMEKALANSSQGIRTSA